MLIQLFRSRTNISQQRDANCIDPSFLTKGSYSTTFFCCTGQVSRPVAGRANTFASAHVLNHTTSPTKHTTLTQANDTKLVPALKDTLHNPIKTPRTTSITILHVNINGITSKQEELKQLANLYIPSRDTSSPHYATLDQHNRLHTYGWCECTLNTLALLHRWSQCDDIFNNSNHITLNTNTPIRVPNTTHQQATSPDITSISTSLYNSPYSPVMWMHTQHSGTHTHMITDGHWSPASSTTLTT